MLQELFLIYINITSVRFRDTDILEVSSKMPHACHLIVSLKACIFYVTHINILQHAVANY